MSNRKWLYFLPVIFLAAVIVCVYWDAIAVYVMPKAVLTEAIRTAAEDFRSDYDQSPVSLLFRYVDPEGQYTAHMDLDTDNDLLGPVSYSMHVRADTSWNRIAAEGVVTAARNDLDLSVYLDRVFMALSSEDLLGGAYYGITYKTFPEDIRSIPMLSMVIGDSILTGWDASVGKVQDAMNQSYMLPELPEISEEDIRQAMTAVLLLPSEVSRVELPVMGEYVQGNRIAYHADGRQVGEILGYLMDVPADANGQIHVSFYLHKNQLIFMSLHGEAGDHILRCALELMVDDNTKTFRYCVTEHAEEQGFCLRYTGETRNSYLYETWTAYPDFEAEGEAKNLAYRWEPVMGELVIDGSIPVTLNVFETEEGLNVQTNQFTYLMALMAGQEPQLQTKQAACNMQLKKGTQINTPEYKNIRDWSLEDLLVLLGGVGSLLGLKTK